MSSEETTVIIGTGYCATIQGICKLVQAISSFIAVLLVGISFGGSRVEFFESAAAISIITASILLILFITGLASKIDIAWNRVLFCFQAVFTVYYLIAASLILDVGFWSRLIAGGVFGIFATLAHLVDAVDNYKKQPLF